MKNQSMAGIRERAPFQILMNGVGGMKGPRKFGAKPTRTTIGKVRHIRSTHGKTLG